MFRLLFERSADAIWLFDPKEQVFVDCNRAAVDLMRSGTRDRLLRMNPEQLSPPLQPDGRPSAAAAQDITETTERQGAHRFHWVARRFDGTDVPLEVNSTVISARGRSVHVVVSRDISERQKAELALKESEQLLSSIADNITEAVYRTDLRHQLVYVNRAYLQMFCYGNLEELQALPRERLYARPETRRRLLARLAEEGRFSEELEFVRKDGTQFWGLISSVAIREPLSGETAFHVGTITDVTERRAAEKSIHQLNANLERRVVERTSELTQSEARLRTLIDHAPEAIVVLDAETGRFLSCNENAARLFGLEREELLNKHPAEVSPPAQPDGRPSLEAARDYIATALSGQPAVFEWTHRRADGRLIPCEIRLVRLPGEGRALVRGSIIDNTERQRREQVQQATFDILEAVHQSGDLESLFPRIHSIIERLMPAQNFYIALFDPATDLISFPYYVEESGVQKVQPRPIGTGLTGYVLRTGRPLLVGSAMNARKKQVGNEVTFEGFDEITYIESGRPAAIWLGVPLNIESKPIGVMAVQDYHDEKAYGEEDKQILTFVARQTALAIDRKRTQQAVLRRAEHVLRHRNSLLELALLDKSDFRTAVETICARAAACAEVTRVGYWSMAGDGQSLECEALYRQDQGRIDPQAAGHRITAKSYPVYFAALATRQPIVADRAWEHSNTKELAEGYLKPLGITSMLDVPVWLNGRLIGVLCHEHVGPARVWSPEEIDFATSVATMVALSVEAAQRKKAEAELRSSEARLRESEDRFSAAFHASPVYITIARLKDGYFVEANEAFVQWLGVERNEILGRTSADLDLWVNIDDRAGFWSELREKGKVRDRECLLRNRRGAEHVALLSGDVIEINKEPHLLTIGLDMTDRKKAEAELLRALGREKELSQLKSNFVSMVSHEFRTPLGIIMSSAEILDDYLDQLEPEERGHHLRSIARNSKRMAEMMEEVLVLGRLDAGRMDFKPAAVEVTAFFERVVDEIRSATENRCPIRLQAASMPAEALADERLLRHVFLNLLTNAVKYSEPGQPVEFSMEREGTDAIFRIADHGIGIPETDLPWLFKAFHRGRNVGQRTGTGLGLVIVKRCVELHGGRIQIESRAGQGTLVTVRLPMFRLP
ncbi:MAG TPA: PAS domain S-box protein [Verrucomicrobiae bacterium]|nr:PAS domain S-box protein [Verrucomicrobiae bacterium]